VSNLAAIACGSAHTVALKADGTVLAWGDNYYNQTDVPAGLRDVVAIAAGWYHSLALKRDGTVVSWGGSGLYAPPAGLSNVIAIAAGSFHNMALKADGSVLSWGNNYCAAPAGLDQVVGIAGGYEQAWALKSDGTVVRWHWPFGKPLVSTNLLADQGRVVAIAGGQDHLLALREDGTVVAWGYGDQGQLQVPVGLTNVAQIACGYWHSLALVRTGCRLSISRGPGSGAPQIDLTGPMGARMLLETTSDLRAWAPLMTVTNTAGRVSVLDPSAHGSPQRFYRAKLLE
jgi:alpha-tubulin suppressor-like RCC1 family protein